MPDTMTRFAVALARAMGAGWRAEAMHERGAHLRHRDGRALFLHAPTYPFSMQGRVEVSGVYPHRQAWRRDRASVTVGISRDPAAIAKDLQRRLMPAYEAELAVALAAEAAQEAAAAEVGRVAAAILAAVPGSDQEVQGVPYGEARVRLRGHGYRHDVRVRGGRDGVEVDMDLRGVPAGDVLRMLTALGEGRPGLAAVPGAVPRARARRARALPHLLGWRRAAA